MTIIVSSYSTCSTGPAQVAPTPSKGRALPKKVLSSKSTSLLISQHHTCGCSACCSHMETGKMIRNKLGVASFCFSDSSVILFCT